MDDDRIRCKLYKSQQQFIADASHEIRTPLTVICSELEAAAQHATDPALKDSIQLSLSETDRLARLADGLLLLARLDAAQVKLTLTPVRLDELIAAGVQRVGALASKKAITFRIDIAEPIEVEADEEKLMSVLRNLLDNAVKYSWDSTTVTISLARSGGDRGNILLAVEDCGAGIPPQAIGSIFNRFYRADASRSATEGHGLGLAIARQLVELHGGTISVRSELGRGSRFTVELPSKSVTGE